MRDIYKVFYIIGLINIITGGIYIRLEQGSFSGIEMMVLGLALLIICKPKE